jgi:Tubulin folding cofactor D C terminal
MEDILRNNLQNDRIVIPALETLAALFEESIFSRLEDEYKLSLIVLS